MNVIKLLSILAICFASNQAIAALSTFISENKNKALIHGIAAGDIKTIPVRPYIKRDGKIVQRHYRSHPRR